LSPYCADIHSVSFALEKGYSGGKEFCFYQLIVARVDYDKKSLLWQYWNFVD
jgi:hypothetical protein